ncbi:MAG: hypothetical protein HZC43_00405 [Nitrosomonadales bacterium]|nr:hypothetical protein [Nitrosomonadales bacterium]
MKPAILTPAQSVEARENLNLQQPAVVSGVKTRFPEITFTKTYLSEFESGARNLPPRTLRAMRDYYEEQGHVFSDAPEAANDPQAGDQVRVVRDALVLSESFTHFQRGAIQDRIKDLLAGLQDGLRKKAAEGFIELYDDETDLARDRAIALLAEVGVLYTGLFGNCPLRAPSEALLKAPRKAKTISDVVALRFTGALLLTEPNPRSESGGGDASGGSSDVPALDGDGQKATTSPATNPDKKPANLPWLA